MASDLTSAGFAFDPDWYWRIVEGDGTFGATAARACLVPLGRLAHGRFELDAVEADPDDRIVHFRINGAAIAIEVGIWCARASADRFVIDLNRHLRGVDHAFALVVPRRFELRGVLLPRSILADYDRDPFLIAPSVRPGWRRFASGTRNPQA
jgi:hypothetical protein